MASINDEIMQNERVKQQGLLLIASNLEMDLELMNAIAEVGYYLNRVLWAYSAREVAREGSTLEKVVTKRLMEMKANG